MESRTESIKRRKFLKAGATSGIFLATLPFWKLLSLPDSVSDRHRRQDEHSLKQYIKKIRDVALKHGGEFAEIKPELRRRSHGRI